MEQLDLRIASLEGRMTRMEMNFEGLLASINPRLMPSSGPSQPASEALRCPSWPTAAWPLLPSWRRTFSVRGQT
jgi:hypothetical protein